MSNTGKCVESVGDYQIYHWTGPQVDTGEYKPYSVSLNGSFEWKRFDSLDDARAWTTTAPKRQKIRVSFEMWLPDVLAEDGDEPTDAQILDWLRFELHANGSLSKNPFMNHGIEAMDVEFD